MKRSLLLALLGGLVAACTIVNGLTTTDVAIPGASDPDAAAVDDVASPTPAVCVPYRPPAPPTSGTRDGNVTFVSAVRSLDLGARDSGEPSITGFDLDNTCTCTGSGGATCKLPASSTFGCDRDGGVDNATTPLVQDGLGFGVDVSDDYAAALRRGQSGFLLWVQDYNGGANDPLVRVGLLVGNGNVAGTKITFAPDEQWNVLPGQSTIDNFLRIVPSTFVDGYVTENQLVVPESTFLLPLLGSHPMRVTNGIVVARIAPADGGFALAEGVLAGRGEIHDLLRAFGGIALPDGGGPLCDSPTPGAQSQLATIEGFVCGRRDIAADPTQDRPETPCGAVSFGIAFRAVPSTIGGQKELDDAPCGDAALGCESL